jgi:secondary thiamine-phosphate synthase enzyme
MEIFWDEIEIQADEYLKIMDITDKVKDMVKKRKIKEGNVCLYNPHVTSAVTINEREPALWQDLLANYKRLVPLKDKYHHNEKYKGIPQEENTHAHILNTLIGQSATVPIREGRLLLGPWQSILFIELDGFKRRKLVVQTIGK